MKMLVRKKYNHNFFFLQVWHNLVYKLIKNKFFFSLYGLSFSQNFPQPIGEVPPQQIFPVYPVPAGTPVVANNLFEQFPPPLSPPSVQFISPNPDSSVVFWTPVCVPSARVPLQKEVVDDGAGHSFAVVSDSSENGQGPAEVISAWLVFEGDISCTWWSK